MGQCSDSAERDSALILARTKSTFLSFSKTTRNFFIWRLTNGNSRVGDGNPEGFAKGLEGVEKGWLEGLQLMYS